MKYKRIIRQTETLYPLWFCLTTTEQSALAHYQGKRHRRKLQPPGAPLPQIAPFNADEEMKIAPKYSREAMR